MRCAPAVLMLLALAGCGASRPAVPAARARPMRVMSVNLCTDQLVLALLPPSRIASVSWLAREPGGSLLARAAMRVPANHASAEEVMAERPDLVIAGSFTTPALRRLLKRVGWPVLEVEEAESVADIRRVTRQVAAALGEQARGEALIARMDAQFAALARNPGPPLRVVAWDRSGFAAGRGTLYDAVLTAAGARNLGRDANGRSGQGPDIELLLHADPALLIQGSAAPGQASLGDAITHHRLVRRYWAGRVLTVPQAAYACGTPFIAEAAIRLRAELRAATDRAGPALPFGATRS